MTSYVPRSPLKLSYVPQVPFTTYVAPKVVDTHVEKVVETHVEPVKLTTYGTGFVGSYTGANLLTSVNRVNPYLGLNYGTSYGTTYPLVGTTGLRRS